MDIQTKKIRFVQKFLSLNDEWLIDKLNAVLQEEIALETRISIEQYNQELDEANARMDAGEYVSHEDVKKESATWLG